MIILLIWYGSSLSINTVFVTLDLLVITHLILKNILFLSRFLIDLWYSCKLVNEIVLIFRRLMQFTEINNSQN